MTTAERGVLKPRRRLSHGLRRVAACALLVPALVTSPRADLLENVTALEVDRHIVVTALPCRSESVANPVTPATPTLFACRIAEVGAAPPSAPVFAVEHALAYRDLLHKRGNAPVLGHEDFTSVTALRYRPRRLDLRLSVAHAEKDRTYSGTPTGFAFEQSHELWALRTSLGIVLGPWFSPMFTLGAGSEAEREAAFSLHGDLSGLHIPVVSGLSWALEAGQRTAARPLVLDLPEYRALLLPFQLRQNYQTASIAWHGGPATLSWTTHGRQNRHPATYREGYSLSANGAVVSHHIGGAWSVQPDRIRYVASLEAEALEGHNTFQGVNTSDVVRLFSYEETRHAARWVRGDLKGGTNRWESGLFLGAGRVTGKALRPENTLDRAFWDRSGAVDDYEGTILNVFERETWLFDGQLGFTQQAVGAWGGMTVGNWDIQGGLAHQRFDFKAQGHLTKYRTVFLIGSEETHHYPDFAGMTLALLTPTLNISRIFGNISLKATVTQAIPLEMTIRGGDGSEDPHSPASSSWSGGSRASAQIGWAAF